MVSELTFFFLFFFHVFFMLKVLVFASISLFYFKDFFILHIFYLGKISSEFSFRTKLFVIF